MNDDWPTAGTLLSGRYRLVALLETGGMAEIWRADDDLLGRPVAVKLPTGTQVAWREARLAARLSHPGIAAVHDYRESVRPDGTVAPFVVMELLPGETVAARLERTTIGWAEAARVGAEVADALAAAHARGVIHRDIKPGNVMLTPNGIKILDFGISASAGEPDEDDTGATFGTPAYVAPERLDGRPAEPATDIYGLGVLLFEMVTGDPPYPVETWEELAVARAIGPGRLPDDLPDPFREVVDRCLDDVPGRRPTADRVRDDLVALMSTTDDAFAPTAAPAGSTDRPAHRRGVAGGRAPTATLVLTSPPRRRWALTVAMVTLAVAIGGAFTAIDWPDHTVDAGPDAAGPGAITHVSVQPSAPPTTVVTRRSGPALSASRKQTPTLTFTDAVARMRTAIQDGATGGQVREDVATDLLNLLSSLTKASTKDVDRRLGEFRRKVQERIVEGTVRPALASVLRSRLADLDRASGM